MATTNDWIEEVKRWVATGTRPARHEVYSGLDVDALGYEAAQPSLQAQERPAIADRHSLLG